MEKVTGHSAEYGLIARSIHLALEDYFVFFEKLPDESKANADAVPNLESRLLTIVLLSAALIECCINVILASNMSEDVFDLIERSSTEEKWIKAPKIFSSDYQFPIGSKLHEDLKFIFRCRNSIMHSKADIYTSAESLRTKGNFERVYLELKHSRLLGIVDLPRRLLEHMRIYETKWPATMGIIIDSEIQLNRFERYLKRETQ